MRLVLGWTAVVIAGVLFYFDWKLGWEQTKVWTLPAVIAYFILNGAFTYWIWFVEKGVIFVGEREGKKVRTSFSSQLVRRHLLTVGSLSSPRQQRNTALFTMSPHAIPPQQTAHNGKRLKSRPHLHDGSRRTDTLLPSHCSNGSRPKYPRLLRRIPRTWLKRLDEDRRLMS